MTHRGARGATAPRGSIVGHPQESGVGGPGAGKSLPLQLQVGGWEGCVWVLSSVHLFNTCCRPGPRTLPPGLCRLRSVPLCAVSTAYVPILHPELEWSVHWSASPTACEQLEVWGLACPSILEPGTELGTEEYQRIVCRVSEEKAK